MLVHLIRDGSCYSALINMAIRAEAAMLRGPYGLSSQIYWYHDGRLELVEIVVDIERRTIMIHQPSDLEKVMSEAASNH